MCLFNKYKSILSFFYIIFFYIPHAYAIKIDETFNANWTGIEVVDTDHETAEKIRNHIKLPIGTPVIYSEVEKYKSSCKKFNENSINLNCSFLLYSDGSAYLNVEVVSNNNGNIYRDIPITKNKNLKIPKKLDLFYEEFDERLSFLMTNNMEIDENYHNCYLDFSDPILHGISKKIAQQCQIYNDLLLKIIRFSHNIEERRKAAILLSWSCDPNNLSYIVKWGLLFDPDAKVRNNLARAYSSRISSEKDITSLESLIPIYCNMMSFPTHMDRNKALFSMNEIIDKYPELSGSIHPKCINRISHIGEMSILENVRDEAKEILNKLK
ncbi:HEAT repeat domain-containing protein [Candidatus Berkiella cookevillensis]|uniref:HEAT repeat domain-containing protein n=1 Tax=Candidatus Berkiella cookevillensis TaxID=437022 RepID=A0A0Q9YQ71_9GAMM|nr:HEAT repeat domain-containing protein [Candidatus Berkiella cookevillensis]MCS5707288.1 HEAT repeat domain-containing protein [Candidatus Berkiella cookevillensis]